MHSQIPRISLLWEVNYSLDMSCQHLKSPLGSDKTVGVAGGWLQVFPDTLPFELVSNNVERAAATALYLPLSVSASTGWCVPMSSDATGH